MRPGIVQTARDCWAYRALIQNLVVRQLAARYRGSALGFLWTFLNPLLFMFVYAMVFTVYMRFSMENYGAFVFSGLLPWLWFTTSLEDGTRSIVGGAGLITRAMFPPEVLPVVAVLTNLCNFLLTLPLLVVVLLIYGILPGATLLALPAVIVVQLLVILGIVLLLAALNVEFRDVQHLLTNLLTLWFFFTPILYSFDNVPEKLRLLTNLNFMAHLMKAYQDIFVFARWPDWAALGGVAVFGVVVLLIGDWTFRRYRETFAEWL